MTTATVNPRMREVLGAPRGRRFSRPSHTSQPAPLTREQRLLAQMRDNPRVAYRLEHGVLPHWMRVAEERRHRQGRPLAEPNSPAVEAVSGSTGGGRHRRSRRRWPVRQTFSYGLAVAGGTFVGQLVAMMP